jgi:hypothetical protein
VTPRRDLATVFAELGITRVCHFTPSRNLPHILRDGEIRPTKDLEEDVRAIYAATDPERLDGHTDKVCCTIEYPNAYYWNKARAKREATLFPTWVVVYIDPTVLFRPGTLFCTGNASRGYGATAQQGIAGLLAAYGGEVIGSAGRIFPRADTHLRASPTDLQAEVLVPGPIPLTKVVAIAVAATEQAAKEHAILVQLSLPVGRVRWVVAPLLFEPYALATAIQTGRPPSETPWIPPEEAGCD